MSLLLSQALPAPYGNIELHSSGNGYPPDHVGMAPASCSTWVRMVGGPPGWWRPEDKSQHKAWHRISQAANPIEVVRLCDLWVPAAAD